MPSVPHTPLSPCQPPPSSVTPRPSIVPVLACHGHMLFSSCDFVARRGPTAIYCPGGISVPLCLMDGVSVSLRLTDGASVPLLLTDGVSLPLHLMDGVPVPLLPTDGVSVPLRVMGSFPVPLLLTDGASVPLHLMDGVPVPLLPTDSVSVPLHLMDGVPVPLLLTDGVSVPLHLMDGVPVPLLLTDGVNLPQVSGQESATLEEFHRKCLINVNVGMKNDVVVRERSYSSSATEVRCQTVQAETGSHDYVTFMLYETGSDLTRFKKIAIPNNKFQMASGQGSHWLIGSPTIFSCMCSPPLSNICKFYFKTYSHY